VSRFLLAAGPRRRLSTTGSCRFSPKREASRQNRAEVEGHASLGMKDEGTFLVSCQGWREDRVNRMVHDLNFKLNGKSDLRVALIHFGTCGGAGSVCWRCWRRCSRRPTLTRWWRTRPRSLRFCEGIRSPRLSSSELSESQAKDLRAIAQCFAGDALAAPRSCPRAGEREYALSGWNEPRKDGVGVPKAGGR